MIPLLIRMPLVAALLAQEEPAPAADVGTRLAGLATQLAASLAVVFVAVATIVIYWHLFNAMLKDPSASKVALVVVAPLVAVFFAGATPDLLDLAYSYGQSFMDGAP